MTLDQAGPEFPDSTHRCHQAPSSLRALFVPVRDPRCDSPCAAPGSPARAGSLGSSPGLTPPKLSVTSQHGLPRHPRPVPSTAASPPALPARPNTALRQDPPSPRGRHPRHGPAGGSAPRRCFPPLPPPSQPRAAPPPPPAAPHRPPAAQRGPGPGPRRRPPPPPCWQVPGTRVTPGRRRAAMMAKARDGTGPPRERAGGGSGSACGERGAGPGGAARAAAPGKLRQTRASARRGGRAAAPAVRGEAEGAGPVAGGREAADLG